MRLHIFQSAQGDCLLLEGKSGGRMLCDGGMGSTMKEFVRDELTKLRSKHIELDYVYVSHIDEDHIQGVLQLLEDEIEWRLFDLHTQAGTPIRKPKVPRPPAIRNILHNAFHDQVGKNRDKIEDMLAAAAPSLLSSSVPLLSRLGAEFQQIATSIPQAIKVSRYIKSDVLDIPLNRLPGSQVQGKLLMIREGQKPFKVGSMSFTIVGPSAKELQMLRKGWNTFLGNEEKLRKLRSEIKRRIDRFSAHAFDLRDWNGTPGFKGVTTPNIASLMFMVEEDGKRLLLTGDSQQNVIIDGLKTTGFLSAGHLHVDVLKVQHHGSEKNADDDFCRQVSADHYVFCGNGSSGNPEPEVIEKFYNARLGPDSKRARSPRAKDRPFKFWFSTTARIAARQHQTGFAEVEKLVRKLRQKSGGLLTAAFNSGPAMVLDV